MPSHTGGAVSVVEIPFQPKVSLFTMFWARAAPKHRYFQAFGRPVLPTILFAQHLPSHTGVAVSLVEIRLQPKASSFIVFWARVAPKHRYLQPFGRPVLPNTIIYAPFALSYWWGCKCRRDPGPAKSIAIYGVLGQGCSKTSLFTCFWEASAPKHHYLRSICPLILVGL